MLSILTTAFVLLFNFYAATKIFADEYYSSGNDSAYSEMFSTVAYGIGNLPDKDTVDYADSDIVGTSTQTIMNEVSFDSIINTSISYMSRKNTYSSIVAPPDTYVNVVYFYKNATGHDVNISQIAVPYRNIGNVVRFTSNVLDNLYVNVTYNSMNYTDIGTYGTYDGLRIPSGYSGKRVIATIPINYAVSLMRVDTNVNGENVEVSALLLNNTNSPLHNVVYKHGDYISSIEIEPNAEYIVQYTIPVTDVNLQEYSQIGIHVDESDAYCVLTASRANSWIDIGTVSVFNLRNDADSPYDYSWSTGSWLQNSRTNFCIKRSAYESLHKFVSPVEESTEISDISDDNTGNTNNNDPITDNNITDGNPTIDTSDLEPITNDIIEEQTHTDVLVVATEVQEVEEVKRDGEKILEEVVEGIKKGVYTLPKTGVVNTRKNTILILVVLAVESYLCYSLYKEIRNRNASKNRYTNICTKSS